MKWEELAYSLLEAKPNDAVKLALAVAEGKPPNLKGADLRALVELEVKPGGGVRWSSWTRARPSGPSSRRASRRTATRRPWQASSPPSRGPPGRSLHLETMEKTSALKQGN